MESASGTTFMPFLPDGGVPGPMRSGADGETRKLRGATASTLFAMRRSRVFVAVVVLAGLAILVQRAARVGRAAVSEGGDVTTAIHRGNAAYLDALKRGDASAYAEIFTPDAISMPARGTMLRGRDAIQASIAEAFRRIAFRDGTLDTTDTRVDGETAYESGRYSFDITQDGSPATLSGRYLVVWRKSGAGWRIALDASQPNAPA